MIKNGRPYSDENGSIDSALLTDHPNDEQELVKSWIGNNIWPRQTPLYERSSYGLKHILQHETGLYLTNNEFKDAMLLCGFQPVNPNKLNWFFCISKRSPAFHKQNNRL